MAGLWGGRFTKKTDDEVFAFNESLTFDYRLFEKDIEGSIAHVVMLEKQHIISLEEKDAIVKGLITIKNDINEGRIEFSHDYEDVHSFVEAKLIELIGDAGKKMHTGRSRNDQVALDMRLYVRDEVVKVDELLLELLKVIFRIMSENLNTYMPGFTHMQKAQPVTVAHHFGAYFEMFRRDRDRLSSIHKRMNYCPLGAGALAGTTYDLDRDYVSTMLGFEGATLNSMDSVSDRDYCIEFLAALSTIMMHLSRFSEEIIIWNSNEYQFIELDDAYSTGSSIMPQKKNPDIAELVRGKTGRVYGALMSLLTTMKGIPLAYNKDMQEDKECIFDSIATVKQCLKVFAPMIETMKVIKENMYSAAQKGFINATDLADYLAKKGLPFRSAYKLVGQIVAYCIDNGLVLETMPLEKYREYSELFEEDLFVEISLETCVSKRISAGGTGPDSVEKQIEYVEKFI